MTIYNKLVFFCKALDTSSPPLVSIARTLIIGDRPLLKDADSNRARTGIESAEHSDGRAIAIG